jgi:hypothetical protein
MKSNLWIIIVVIAVFLGFMMGYTVPPFLESGVAGGKGGAAAGAAPKIDKDMQEYYKNLLKEE